MWRTSGAASGSGESPDWRRLGVSVDELSTFHDDASEGSGCVLDSFLLLFGDEEEGAADPVTDGSAAADGWGVG